MHLEPKTVLVPNPPTCTCIRVSYCYDRQECEEYIASLWDWLEALGTGIQRQDPNTWTPEKWPPTYRGILNSLEIAHQSFVWRVRKNECIRKVSFSFALVELVYLHA